jgi:hypothetical protein
MLNAFDIIYIFKMMEWFDGQDIGVEPGRPRVNPFYPTYIM